MIRLKVYYEKMLFAGVATASAMILFLALSVSTDIFLRNLGWGNLPWVLEISEYLLFISTFLAAPWVLRMGGHVRVDVLVRILPPKAARVVGVFANLVGLVVCLVLLYYGSGVALEAVRLNSLIFKFLVVPEWWLMLFIPLAAFFLAVEFLLHLLAPGEAEENRIGGGTPGEGF